jgi:hypothetical protein
MKRWNDSNANIQKLQHLLHSIPTVEQDTTLSKARNDNWSLCTSDQTTISKLKRNPLFTVENITVSPDVRNLTSVANLRILQVTGTLPAVAVSFRTKLTTRSLPVSKKPNPNEEIEVGIHTLQKGVKAPSVSSNKGKGGRQ